MFYNVIPNCWTTTKKFNKKQQKGFQNFCHTYNQPKSPCFSCSYFNFQKLHTFLYNVAGKKKKRRKSELFKVNKIKWLIIHLSAIGNERTKILCYLELVSSLYVPLYLCLFFVLLTKNKKLFSVRRFYTRNAYIKLKFSFLFILFLYLFSTSSFLENCIYICKT